MNDLQKFWNEEDGMGTVEIVLIIAALVAVALLFRESITKFMTVALGNVFGKDTTNATKVTSSATSGS